jgi:VanZ family protein
MRPIAWLPPVVWMAVIFLLSTDAGSAEHTGRWLAPLLRDLLPAASPTQIEALHGLIRKAAHVTEYAVLAALWFRALVRGRGWSAAAAAWTALAISAAWAALDETHQLFVASRGASIADVGLDALGAAAAALTAGLGWRQGARRATVVLLWLAAVGGIAALALNAAAGVSSGVLWVTTPVAAGALVLRRWLGTS